MSTIGERLKEERKRLGMSQTEFAEKLGMHRNSQSRYESGEREFEASYLQELGKIGVDILYVMTGIGKEDDDLYDLTVNRLFAILCDRIGIDHDSREDLILKAFEIEKSTLQLEYGHKIAGARVDELVANLMLSKLGDLDLIDLAVLTAVFEGIELALAKTGRTIEPAQKAGVAMMLYRKFKTSSQVDQKVVEEAIVLASSEHPMLPHGSVRAYSAVQQETSTIAGFEEARQGK